VPVGWRGLGAGREREREREREEEEGVCGLSLKLVHAMTVARRPARAGARGAGCRSREATA